MEIKSHCIMLRSVRYKDNRAIATCLVRELGRVSFMVADGAGREARRRRALMMPGSTFQCVIDFRESRSVQTMTDIAAVRPIIIDNPAKTTIILFLCDLLNSLLRDCQRDPLLFDYIDQAIDAITHTDAIANAPLCFLIGLQQFMGIRPDTSTYSPGSCLDLRGGIFTTTPPLHGEFLTPEQSAAARQLLRMTPRNMHRFHLSRADRQLALDTLLNYYSRHFGTLRSLPSLPILRSLFS